MTGPERQPGAAAAALLAVAIFLWGTSYWPVEIAAPYVPSLTFSALRALPAGLALLLVLPLLGARLPRGRVAVWAAVTGLLMVGVFFYALTDGTIRAGAGNASVLVNTSPFFVLLLGTLLLRERATLVGVAGLAIGFAGVVLMVSSQLGHRGDAGSFALGIGLALGAALAWAGGTLVVKWLVGLHPDVDLVGFTAVQYLAGGAVLAAVALAVEGTAPTQWGRGALWGPVAYLALGNAALASIAYFAALKRLTATRTAAAAFLVPVVAVLVEIGRGNAPGAVVLVGMAMTILGVALVNTPPSQLAGLVRRERRVLDGPASADVPVE